MWVTMIFNAPLCWNLLLPIFIYCVVAQSEMVTGSDFDYTSSMTDVGTTARKAQGLFTRICGPGTDRCVSDGYAITTSNDATTRQLNLTQIVQTSFNVVGGVTLANAQSPVTETLGPSAGVDVTTATNKMAKVLTQIAIDNYSQNDTMLFFGNDSDVTRANNLSNDVYENSTDVSRLLRNDSWELYPRSNASHSVMVGTRGNTTLLPVEEDYWQERLSVTLFSCISPFVIIIGTLGNAVSVVTFQHRHFRYSSTGFILSALSAVDIAVLNTSLMSFWLISAFGINIRDLSRFSCKVGMVLFYYLHNLASWTLVLLTVERSISVLYPLRCKELCSKRRIVIIWLIIAVVLFAENTLFVPAFDLLPTTSNFGDNNITKVEYSCSTVDDYWSHFVYGRWAIVDAVIADFFPFLVILIGNILIITRILRSRWERKTQMGAVSTTKPMASTTGKLIGISVMFLILNIPFDGTYFYYFNTERNSLPKEEKAIYDLANCVSVLLYNSNSAFEFIVYFVGGRKFRQAFLETFLPCRKTNSQNVQRTNERRITDTRVTSSEM